jgi:hypothetical protein
MWRLGGGGGWEKYEKREKSKKLIRVKGEAKWETNAERGKKGKKCA